MQSGHVESPPETKPPFRIESVGHYLRRNRKKARVICVDADADWTVISIDETEPCHEVLVYHHLADGRCYLTEESPNDIVAPWVDPVTEGGR